jgi:hypothetical protein
VQPQSEKPGQQLSLLKCLKDQTKYSAVISATSRHKIEVGLIKVYVKGWPIYYLFITIIIIFFGILRFHTGI